MKFGISPFVGKILRPRGKDAFVHALSPRARVFDIGCGNGSPHRVKIFRPDLYYVGLDIEDYNQEISPKSICDEYIVTSPTKFCESIEAKRNSFDAVISSHNLEHCADDLRVVAAMSNSLKLEGLLYLSFPSEASLSFPRRSGTLNFLDDSTHVRPPPWREVMDILGTSGMQVLFSAQRYRPLVLAGLGAALEPFSLATRRVMPLGSTWAYWGFESVVWAKKILIRNEFPDVPSCPSCV